MNAVSQEQSQEKRFSLKIKKSTIWAFISILLYKIVLDLSYYFVISQVWGYAKFTLELNSLKLVESYLLLLIIFILMPKSGKKLSHVMVWLLILLSYIPILTIFAFQDESRAFMYAVSGFWIAVFLLIRMPSISLPPLKQSSVIRYGLFVCLTAVVFFLVYKYFGISFNFDLFKVYEIRAEQPLSTMPMGGYLLNWVGKILNPIFFALFIHKRKWLLVGIIVFLQIWLFSVTGHKTFLLALPFVLGLMWLTARKNSLAYLATSLVAIVFLGILTYWLADNLLISSLFARRALLTQGQLSFFYYDFFSHNELVFLSNSKLGFLATYPYALPPPNIIGGFYFGNVAMNANTGVVGDAYMQFGFIGLALYSVFLAIILKMVDSCSRRVDPRVAVAAIAMPVISLTNGALTTAFLTGGLFLALIILYLLPRKAEGNLE
jgi:hypothetical protein